MSTSIAPTVTGRALNVTLEVDGPLSTDGLRSALEPTTAAHPSLHGAGHVPTDVHSAAVPPGPDQLARAFDLAEEFSSVPVPPDGPRLHALLLHLEGTERSLVALAVDPQACDAWSATLLTDALVRALTDVLDGRAPTAPETTSSLVARAPVGPADVRAAREAVAGCAVGWQVPTAPTPRARAVLDLPDDVAQALLTRSRQHRTSLLAPLLVAAQLLQPDPATPRAVVSTLVGRADAEQWAAFGHLATDVWLPVRLRGLRVADAVRAVRDDVLRVVTALPVDWRVTRETAAGTDGVTLSVLYLPAQLSGGAPGGGDGRVTRAAVSICPTGADVDLCVVESPPPDATGARPLVRLVAEVNSTDAGVDAPALLAAWADVAAAVAASDWDTTGWPSLMRPVDTATERRP